MDATPGRTVIAAETCEVILAGWEGLRPLRRRAAEASSAARVEVVEALQARGGEAAERWEPGDWPEWSPLDLRPEARPPYHPVQLLPLFPGLRLEPGWELDYVLYEEEFGFEVTLYTRPAGGPHASRHADVPHEAHLLPGLAVAPGPEGAFEFSLFLLLARLLFHRFDEDQPAFTRGRFLAHARRITQCPGAEIGPAWGDEPSAEPVDWEARFASEPPDFFLPAVEPVPGDVWEVSMIWFTRWGGLQRRRFHARADRTVVPCGKQVLVPYDCGEIY